MTSMYRGTRRWTKEQVIFACEVCIAAALDRIETALPPGTPAREFKSRRLTVNEWIEGCMATAGAGLSIIYAQLTVDEESGVSIGVDDALASIEFEQVVAKFIEDRLKDENAPRPDTHQLARSYVWNAFGTTWFRE